MKKLRCLYGDTADMVPQINIILMCMAAVFIICMSFRSQRLIYKQERVPRQRLAIIQDRNIYWIRRMQYMGKHGRPSGSYWDYLILN